VAIALSISLSSISLSITNAVKALAEHGDDATITDFLIEIDERVMIEEFRASCLAKVKETAPTITRVLWRGADAKGYPAFWIAKINDQRHVFLGKVGRRWGLEEGDPDGILALIPDDLFEAAAMMVYERDDKV